MKTLRCSAVFLCALLAALSSSPGADPATPALPTIPASLAVPAGQEVDFVLTAKGVQIYECRALAAEPGKFEWAFKSPEADLFDAQGRKVGKHFAGPTWELTDGGKVVGKLKSKADAPDGKGIPWLLLEAAENHGDGTLGKIRSIQRVSTVGGKAPSEAADQTKAGQERRVEYTATYVFYSTKS